MKIQSLSVCVPAGCPNDCKFCVAKMNNQPSNQYANQIERNRRFADLYERDYAQRLAFARDNGCNTLMYTSSGEALMNVEFIKLVARMNRSLPNPFRWIELQTSGVKLDDEMLRFLRNSADISVISLSLSDVFDSRNNAAINGISEKLYFELEELCSEIKKYDFSLRLSLNMSDVYNNVAPQEIFERAAELGANQVTFRKLFLSDIYEGSPQAKWIEQHEYKRTAAPAANPEYRNERTGLLDQDGLNDIVEYITTNGTALEVLPFGAMRYSIRGISTVVDTNCMNKGVKDDGGVKYLVLRPDCKLYTRWDDKGSRLF